MRQEYTLYLDESYEDKSNVFCIAGCAFLDSDIPQIENTIGEIKKIIWSEDEISRLSPVLHSTEFNFVFKNRSNPKRTQESNGAYSEFAKHTKEEIADTHTKVYAKLSETIKKQNIWTFCCIIDRNMFKDTYMLPNNPRLIDDWYDIAMQEILEAFTHFLCKVNGVGSIIYEARDNGTSNRSNTSDNKMFHNFCKIKVNGKGTDYLTNRAIYEHIRFLNIVTKADDIPGLQLADFIAFNYIKWYKRPDEQRTDFMKRIHLAAYNGLEDLATIDRRKYFGLKLLPIDYLESERLKKELKTLKRAHANLKQVKNSLLRKNGTLKEEKTKVQEQLKTALSEIEQLKKMVSEMQVGSSKTEEE